MVRFKMVYTLNDESYEPEYEGQCVPSVGDEIGLVDHPGVLEVVKVHHDFTQGHSITVKCKYKPSADEQQKAWRQMLNR